MRMQTKIRDGEPGCRSAHRRRRQGERPGGSRRRQRRRDRATFYIGFSTTFTRPIFGPTGSAMTDMAARLAGELGEERHQGRAPDRKETRIDMLST